MEWERLRVGGDDFNVAVRSGAPTLLFLHGLAGHAGEWGPVVELLPADVGYVCPDLRAHGRTWELGTRDVSAGQFTDDAVSLIEQLNVGPVVVVGQSMGGIVATLMAHGRPDLVSHLVLVEAGIGPMVESDFAALKHWFDSWPAIFADESEAIEFFGVTQSSTPAWVQGLASTSAGLERRFDADTMIETMRLLATDNRWSEWADLAMPVTIVTASNSMIDAEEIAQMRETQPSADLVVIEDCSHDVHLDQPVVLTKLLARVLDLHR